MAAAETPNTRWAVGGHSVRETHQFGLLPGEELRYVGDLGILPSGDLLVYDMVDARLLQLAPDLQFVAQWAGKGEGPGELRAMGFLPIPGGGLRHLAVSDSLVALYNWPSVHWFSPRGQFLRAEKILDGTPFQLGGGALDVAALPTGFFYALTKTLPDSSASRLLTLWRRNEGDTHAVYRRSLPPLPRTPGGVVVRGAEEAVPRWVAGAHLAVVTDGFSDALVIQCLVDGASDSLPLPPYAPPPESREVREEWRRSSSRMLGVQLTEYPAPARQARWTSLAIDPDGFIWIRLWRPRGPSTQQVLVYILDPRTGAVTPDSVPAFPLAFGPPGIFYSRSETVDGVPYVARFEVRGNSANAGSIGGRKLP